MASMDELPVMALTTRETIDDDLRRAMQSLREAQAEIASATADIGSHGIFGQIMSAVFGTERMSNLSFAVGDYRVDVAPILDKFLAAKGEKLDWRTSIVDFMKALDIDSSLTTRKALAKELHYTGDVSDSASMNIWLHKQVMAKIAANGGKVPPEWLEK